MKSLYQVVFILLLLMGSGCGQPDRSQPGGSSPLNQPSPDQSQTGSNSLVETLASNKEWSYSELIQVLSSQSQWVSPALDQKLHIHCQKKCKITKKGN